jgi:CRISPR-associated protein Csm3
MAKLEKKIFIKGKVQAVTGLMIGATNSALEIGGTDKQIVRHPVTKIPYIPGSSLKGKMRSLLELSRAELEFGRDGAGPTQNPTHIAARLFGHLNRNTEKKQQPSRLIVRDGELTIKSREMFRNTELPYSEIKAENSIDRITAVANPRFFERVPAGAEFDMSLVLNVFEGDDELLEYVYKALELVEDDYLGGGGSRGNGQVRIVIERVQMKTYHPTAQLVEQEIPQRFRV